MSSIHVQTAKMSSQILEVADEYADQKVTRKELQGVIEAQIIKALNQ